MYPYQNANLTIKERVADLISKMSLKEKVGQVNQNLYGWETFSDENHQEFSDTFKKHVVWGGGLGALYGLFRADPWSQVNFDNGILAEKSWEVSNRVQRYVIENSRWGIPALIVEECPHGHQGLGGVSYPTNIGKGNSFNTDLMKKTANLMSKELALKGVNLALISTLDLVKDPRWGRSEECFGEDPILAARMTEAIVSGFQEDLISPDLDYQDQKVVQGSRAVGVVLKHCIAQGEAQGGHNSGTVTIGSREYSDIYKPLLKSVKQAAGVMAAYNDIDGVPCHINQELLSNQLRTDIGFQGIVMADGLALDRLSDVFDEKSEAAAAAMSAGVDLSLWDQTYLEIESAILSKKMDIAILDQAVSRILGLKFLLGLFDDPYITDPKKELELVLKESGELNLEIAQESLTLIKNNGLLPLKTEIKNIAVVGQNADNIYHLLGDYTAPQSETIVKDTLFQKISQTFIYSTVTYSEGCQIRSVDLSGRKIKDAIKVAEKADVIINVLGGSSARNFDMEFLKNGAVSSKGINMDSGENVDVASLKLGGDQLKLLRELSMLNKPIVSIVVQGRPYELTEVENLSDAVLIGWFPGQKGGEAIANTLIGANNPSGRLSLSYPINSEQLPVYYYQRNQSKQDHYYDQSGSPAHPFGFGLSYTQFSYRELKVSSNNKALTISVKVKNIGGVSGKESTLLFVQLLDGTIIQRKKILIDFQKNYFMPNEEKILTFNLLQKNITYMDSDYQIKESQHLKIMINNLSADSHF